MKYGIKTIYTDHTPGFKSTDTIENWFDTKKERDEYYKNYCGEFHPRSLKEQYETEIADSEDISYELIEKE